MLKKIPFWILASLFLSSCNREDPKIRVSCEATLSGNYVIKWETFPPINGSVKIYESYTPDSPETFIPVVDEVPIERGFREVFSMHYLKRSYFKLVFNKKYTIITAERWIQTQNLFNLRDLGGYYNEDDRPTRWGRLYRSSSLASASQRDVFILNNLGIKTVIDFRTDKEKLERPTGYPAAQIFNLPLRGNPTLFPMPFDKIMSKKIKRTDAELYMQDFMLWVLENNSDYFEQLFDILLTEKNYPIVMNCHLGNDRCGLATALILAALDIDNEQIINDFVLSNNLIPYDVLFSNAHLWDEDIQETMTARWRAHESSITSSFERLIRDKEYASMDEYFEKDLKLTPKKREKLKEIMLYQTIK
jgi:protein-tyrosine phosphatase